MHLREVEIYEECYVKEMYASALVPARVRAPDRARRSTNTCLARVIRASRRRQIGVCLQWFTCPFVRQLIRTRGEPRKTNQIKWRTRQGGGHVPPDIFLLLPHHDIQRSRCSIPPKPHDTHVGTG